VICPTCQIPAKPAVADVRTHDPGHSRIGNRQLVQSSDSWRSRSNKFQYVQLFEVDT
jgi:hypothetical protein